MSWGSFEEPRRHVRETKLIGGQCIWTGATSGARMACLELGEKKMKTGHFNGGVMGAKKDGLVSESGDPQTTMKAVTVVCGIYMQPHRADSLCDFAGTGEWTGERFE